MSVVQTIPAAATPADSTQREIRVNRQDSNTSSNQNRELTPLETISHGGPTLQGPPANVSFAAERLHRLNHMAAVFRHWSREGYFPQSFWTNPLGVHFGLLTASDIVLVNLDGRVIGGNRSRPANTAGFLIHAAVHEARGDVDAACHCHSPAGKAWSATGRRLDMMTQDACKFLGDAHAVYDAYGGIDCPLARPARQGCILKNHGLLTVGRTVDEAAWLFDATEHACRDQLAVEAATAGGVNGVTKALIGEEQARVNFELEADADYCYAEFQVYYDYEYQMSGGQFTK
ncbi:hypothetical protein PG994_013749 [Apiospora phragmitis]|uniref:Class II aldolase/adducin N-terminal domain-containing protein n=1 Tax=Apiospora phragmitis TaxID=2905665 RepID=A0ABR1T2C1_9PEZI